MYITYPPVYATLKMMKSETGLEGLCLLLVLVLIAYVLYKNGYLDGMLPAKYAGKCCPCPSKTPTK
jgi:hypothetical protein